MQRMMVGYWQNAVNAKTADLAQAQLQLAMWQQLLTQCEGVIT